MTAFTVVGEALVDIIAGSPPREAPGGSPLNVAVTLGRLGDDVELLTAIGDDRHGQSLAQHLRSARVALHPGLAVLDRTSTALARMAEDGSASYEFDLDWRLVATDAHASWLHAGSIGMFLAPGADGVERMLRRAASGGRTVISLDPNIRPSLIASHARTLRQFERAVQLAHIVKMSDEDARWLYGSAEEGVLDHLHSLGARVAVMTRGVRGALIHSTEARVEVPAEIVDVADTIGAGDAFMGGFLHALAARVPSQAMADGAAVYPEVLTDAARFASHVAAITVSRPGADPPWNHELTTSGPGEPVTAEMPPSTAPGIEN